MIFNEVYGNYYDAVSEILTEALHTPVTEDRMREIVSQKAFSESILSIPSALKSGRWPLIDKDGNAMVFNTPYRPLSLMQKRWLKSILSDPRVKLFGVNEAGLEHVEPLFDKDTIIYFDQYLDGDPFEDPSYINNFKMILFALENEKNLRITYPMRKGGNRTSLVVPHNLEYSPKDNKFRINGRTKKHFVTINIAKIVDLSVSDEELNEEFDLLKTILREVEMLLTDERNALERAMLHFSHFEKQTERIDDNKYRFLIKYDEEDETEILIRIMSFGPLLEVVGPDCFREQIIKKLKSQKSCE